MLKTLFLSLLLAIGLIISGYLIDASASLKVYPE